MKTNISAGITSCYSYTLIIIIYLQLERWEASIQDYEIMLKENPKDRDVEKALYVAQVHAQKQLSEDIRNMKNNASSNLVMISSKEHFRRFVIAPGDH